MKRQLFAAVALIVVAGCASSSWQENDFLVDGKKTSLPPAEMQKLRSAWSSPVPYATFNTSLTPAEARWTADFISLSEGRRDRPCHRLVLVAIGPSPGDIATLAGKHTPAAHFDEKWVLAACGSKTAYRAFHPQYSTVLAVEEVRL